PSSLGNPITTGWFWRSLGSPPCHRSTTSPRRGSSGSARRKKTSVGVGSSADHHAAGLDDRDDMIDSEGITQPPVIGYVANNQVRLLTDFNGTDPIAAPQRCSGVQRERGDDLRGKHFHLRACHRPEQRQVFGHAATGIAV